MRYLVFLMFGVICLWLVNTSMFLDVAENQPPKLIAHRGVHQVFTGKDRSAESCRAPDIAKIDHSYIENTVPSIKAAFEYGADVVEIDVHRTTDDVFVVFHDWTLDCQTNGAGVTKDQSYSYIASLDAGYGFTDDQGKSYPLRGTGFGLIPRLEDIMSDPLAGQILVNYKSNRKSDGVISVPLLDMDKTFGVYGGVEPTQAALALALELRGYDKRSLKSCLLQYMALGWSGYVPKVCRNSIVGVPLNYAPFVWGWPHRYTKRMERHGSSVILWGDYDGSGFTSGIDTLADLDRVPKGFSGYIWTNRIETIGPALKD